MKLTSRSVSALKRPAGHSDIADKPPIPIPASLGVGLPEQFIRVTWRRLLAFVCCVSRPENKIDFFRSQRFCFISVIFDFYPLLLLDGVRSEERGLRSEEGEVRSEEKE